jgi:hypothetical protein
VRRRGTSWSRWRSVQFADARQGIGCRRHRRVLGRADGRVRGFRPIADGVDDELGGEPLSSRRRAAIDLVGRCTVCSAGGGVGGAVRESLSLYRGRRGGEHHDCRGRVVLVQVLVTDQTVTKVKALTLGRAKVVLVIFHPSDLHWGNARVSWSFASGSRGRFSPAPDTRSVNLSPYVVVAFTTATLPAGHFRWRACLHAPEAQALANPSLPPGCSGRGYYGGGYLPVGFPGPVAIARAERYLRTRTGRTALAVVDSEGRVSGVNVNEQFITGSVVKAMLLVAYLRRLNAMGQHYVDSYSNSFLYPMINVSDNDAATECWSIVGNAGLYAVAKAAGMTHFSVDTTASWGGEWGAALITAADQARFFFEMDSLIPREFVGYANFLLSTIAGYESWGIPAIARPLGYTVYFKAGWRPSPDVFLVHQIARVVGHRHTFAMAVMTDGDPDMSYGIDTIQGVTAALLG